MNAKKNVLCEKPLAMNTKEVQEILAAAKKNDVFIMEVYLEKSMRKRKLTSQFYFLPNTV